MRRRGGIYIVVLSTSAIVTVIGLASMAAWRLQSSAGQMTADSAQARPNTDAGLDLAAFRLAADPSWRTNPQGAWWTAVPLPKER